MYRKEKQKSKHCDSGNSKRILSFINLASAHLDYTEKEPQNEFICYHSKKQQNNQAQNLLEKDAVAVFNHTHENGLRQSTARDDLCVPLQLLRDQSVKMK